MTHLSNTAEPYGTASVHQDNRPAAFLVDQSDAPRQHNTASVLVPQSPLQAARLGQPAPPHKQKTDRLPWRSFGLTLGIVSIVLFGFGVAFVSTNIRLTGGIIMLVLGILGLTFAGILHGLHLKRSYRYGVYLPWIPRGMRCREAAVVLPILLALLVLALVGISLLDDVTQDGRIYADLEYANSNSNVRGYMNDWDRASLAAMAASSGFHIFTAALYTSILLLWHLRIATVATVRLHRRIATTANFFSPLALLMGTCYTCGHCCLMSLLVSRSEDSDDDAIARAATVFISLFYAFLGPLLIGAIVLTIMVLACTSKHDHATHTVATVEVRR